MTEQFKNRIDEQTSRLRKSKEEENDAESAQAQII